MVKPRLPSLTLRKSLSGAQEEGISDALDNPLFDRSSGAASADGEQPDDPGAIDPTVDAAPEGAGGPKNLEVDIDAARALDQDQETDDT